MAEPKVPAPPALRRFFRFAKLPDPALVVVRRVLDGDEALRARVREVAAADPGLVGEAGWLFIDRPDGWEQTLQELVVAAAASRGARSAGPDRRSERERQRSQRARERAEAELAEAEQARRQAREALARERSARRAAEERLAEVEKQVASLRRERDGAVRALKDLETRHAARTAQLRDLEAAMAARDRSLAETRAQLAERERALEAAEAHIDELERALFEVHLDASPPGAALAGPAGRPARRARRSPRRLPVGLFDDSVEAARFLLGQPGAVAIVDGYNVALRRWPDLPLASRRDRLVQVVETITARTGASAVVVFDGAEVGRPGGGAGARHVQVRFTPEGVEADDVIIELVAEYPAHQPIVVVSDDRRVRDGARANGAAVISVEPFLGLLA